MSIINEALKKISEEKKEDKVVSYNSEPSTFVSTEYKASADATLNKKRWIFIGAVGALLASVILYLFIVISFRAIISPSNGNVSSEEASVSKKYSGFSLNGIIYAPGDPQALINDDILRIGDEVNGAVVQDILPKKVVLRKGLKEFELIIK